MDLPPPGAPAPFSGALLPVPLDPLIGRTDEVARTIALLRQSLVRLVTLTGPGGVGKTRLAIQVAMELRPEFEAGVAFVPLASLRDPSLLLPTIADAIGVPESTERTPMETLVREIGDRQLLLVLDNLEQLVRGAPRIAELLAQCPALTVLATSRALLRLSGEHDFDVPPLPLPEVSASATASDLAANSAVSLFVGRARAARPSFTFSDSNAPVIAATCRRLDGLPLAIELAAARVRHLSPEALLSRMERRLPLLTGGARDQPARLQTLRHAIEWSYDLLDDIEQALFRRLAVFVGGFTLEAAAAVCGADEVEVLDGIASLLDKSLAHELSTTTGEPRYGMLETIREFGTERLALSGHIDAVRQTHAQVFLAFAERAEPELHGADQAAWFDRLAADHDNLRAALAWAEEQGDAEFGQRLAGALWLFWSVRGHSREGGDWLDRMLALPGAVDAESRAQTHFTRGLLARSFGDYDLALRHGTAALEAAQEANDALRVARVELLLGWIAEETERHDTARGHFESALAHYQRMNDSSGIAVSLHELGWNAYATGDIERAEDLAATVLDLNRNHGVSWGAAQALHDLGRIAADRRDFAAARRYFGESLDLLISLHDQWYIALPPAGLARLAAESGDLVTAVRLASALEARHEQIPSPIWHHVRPTIERVMSLASANLPAEEIAAARRSADAMPMVQVVETARAYASSATDPPKPAAGSEPRIENAAGLSQRELEVLHLVARGRTNQEIGDALYIGRGTVRTHVSNILGKLGAHSRTEAADIARRRGILS